MLGARGAVCVSACLLHVNTDAPHDSLFLFETRPTSSSKGRCISGQGTFLRRHATACACGARTSALLQAAASALAQGQVPLSWDALWEGPASPLDYMRSAVRR